MPTYELITTHPLQLSIRLEADATQEATARLQEMLRHMSQSGNGVIELLNYSPASGAMIDLALNTNEIYHWNWREYRNERLPPRHVAAEERLQQDPAAGSVSTGSSVQPDQDRLPGGDRDAARPVADGPGDNLESESADLGVEPGRPARDTGNRRTREHHLRLRGTTVTPVETIPTLRWECPHIFADAEFKAWLNQAWHHRARCFAATWHRGGEPHEFSDVFLVYDHGELSNSLPEHIEALIRDQWRSQVGQDYGTIWLVNLEP